MTTVVLELDPQMAGHLAVAIELYRRELRKADGWSGPTGLEELGHLARNRARSGQDGTDIADFAASLHDRRVAPLLLSKREAAEVLGVSARSVSRLVADGQLALVHIGGASRIRMSDLEDYVANLGPRPLAERVETKTPPSKTGRHLKSEAS